MNVHYVLWGEIAHTEAIVSLRQLGESIEEFVFERIPPGVRPARGDYNGSLAALVKVAESGETCGAGRKICCDH